MRQMMISELLLNPSVPEKDEKRLNRQAIKIYKLLFEGPVWTNQMNSNARIHELRAWLAKCGLTIDKTGGPDILGNYKYEIVELDGSQYQKLLLKKGRMP